MRKQPNLVVKIATILSSLLLVGGCVSYRSGVFDTLPEVKPIQDAKQENPSKPASNTAKLITDLPPADPAGSEAKKSDPVIFSGTKAPILNSVITP